jgi:hypothetical protein
MKKIVQFLLILGLTLPYQPAYAGETDILITMEEKVGGYDRSLFKHWVDADKNGCNTRQEVLIEEAIVKPKIGKKCVLSGGTWLSSYDNKTIKGSGSLLDVDHMVPLAEAWRSGAWQWTNKEREQFANELVDSQALIAVTASSNRSKGDRDPANWLPKASKEVVCDYVFAWVAVKLRFYLTVDPKESSAIEKVVFDPECNARNEGHTFKPLLTFEKYHVNYTGPTPTPSPSISAPSTFKMPLVSGRVGVVLSNWTSYGFTKSPIVISRASPIKEYGCLPVSNEDFVIDSSPSFNSIVDKNTQVTLSTICNVDFNVPKPSTPTPTATPIPSQTPTPTPTPTQTTTPSPTPTPTTLKPAPIKYRNCTEARAAGVTPINRSTDPELYALNTSLDGDKDGDACE